MACVLNSNIKFHENPSSVDGQTDRDRHKEAISRFSKFC